MPKVLKDIFLFSSIRCSQNKNTINIKKSQIIININKKSKIISSNNKIATVVHPGFYKC